MKQAIILLLALALAACEPAGPDPTHAFVTTKVTRCWVDTSGGSGNSSTSSHYMVGTLDGVFEVDNKYGVFNADELYAKIEPGKRYTLEVRGKKELTRYTQKYPYILSVSAIHDGKVEP